MKHPTHELLELSRIKNRGPRMTITQINTDFSSPLTLLTSYPLNFYLFVIIHHSI